MSANSSPQFTDTEYWKQVDDHNTGWSRHQQVSVGAMEFGLGVVSPKRKTAVMQMGRYLDTHESLARDADDESKPADSFPNEHGSYTTPGQTTWLESSHASPWKVDYAMSHSGMQHTIPTLLGTLAHHSMLTSKQFPTADDDLSSHSVKMVDKLAGRGIIEHSNPGHDALNSYRMDKEAADAADHVTDRHGPDAANKRYSDNRAVELDHHSQQFASNLVRNVLRQTRGRERRKPSQGAQLHLFNDYSTPVEKLR